MEQSVMQSITLRTHVGSDGLLQLQIPIGVTETELEVTVTFKTSANHEKTPEELGWSPGFFEQTAGALADDPIERGAQGELQEREPLSDISSGH